jgi:hypothetical protein
MQQMIEWSHIKNNSTAVIETKKHNNTKKKTSSNSIHGVHLKHLDVLFSLRLHNFISTLKRDVMMKYTILSSKSYQMANQFMEYLQQYKNLTNVDLTDQNWKIATYLVNTNAEQLNIKAIQKQKNLLK